MGIPNEIKIGILGAGGKMGMRISANLKELRNEIFFIENAEIGIKRQEDSGLKVSAPAEVMDQSAATSRDGPGPFQGPSSYPQFCWWSLI